MGGGGKCLTYNTYKLPCSGLKMSEASVYAGKIKGWEFDVL